MRLEAGEYLVHVAIRQAQPDRVHFLDCWAGEGVGLERMEAKMGSWLKHRMLSGESTPGKARWLKHRCLL